MIAESFLQIEGKYRNSYSSALIQIREERARYIQLLKSVPGIRVIPSQANYVMIELVNGTTATELTRTLLSKHNLFVKDLSVKSLGGEYIRIAVRDNIDNDKLIDALKQEMKQP